MSYPFVQGITYGPRDGTLGLSFHMSEGYDGLPQFLSQHPGENLWEWGRRVSGVSCHVAILSTGKVVQMLDWGHASGNLNPADRADEYGYYGGSHLRAVLGPHWTDPNAWTLSAEIAGFRRDGPTQAQVRATIAWGLEMRDMFPTIRGATGHHDQSPKACPGLTAAMKAIFFGVGGHGLFKEDEMPLVAFKAPANEVGGIITVKTDSAAIPLSGEVGERLPVSAGITRPALGVFTLDALADRPSYLMLVGPRLAFIATSAVDFREDATAGEDALLTAKREGYDLARIGSKIHHPVPEVTWPPRP